MRQLFDPEVLEYCVAHSMQPDDVLRELERETNLSTVTPQMIAGPYQGAILYFLARMCNARSALEIGTFTGYSAICIARGLAAGGHLDTIEINAEREAIIRKYLKRAKVDDRTTLHIGDAFELIPVLDKKFDFVFIDAGKRDNEAYFDMVLEKVAPNGLILLDNVLWGGKVIHEPGDTDASSIMDLNDRLANDERLECLMLPVRDGITLIRKK